MFEESWFEVSQEGRMTDYQKGFEILQNLIAKRWIPEILCSISQGNFNYTTILNSIKFLSQTELQRKLKVLEEYKCVVKYEASSEYHLTVFGDEVNHLFQHFYSLGKKHQVI